MLTSVRQALRRVGITLDTFGHSPTTYRLFLPGRTLSLLVTGRDRLEHRPPHVKVQVLGGAGYARWISRPRCWYVPGFTIWLQLDRRQPWIGISRNANTVFNRLYPRPPAPVLTPEQEEQAYWEEEAAAQRYRAGYDYACGYHD